MENFGQNIDRDERGRVIAHPLVAMQTSEQGLAVFVRLEWTESQEAKSVQLFLSPEDAREIGESLVRVAAQHGSDPGKAASGLN